MNEETQVQVAGATEEELRAQAVQSLKKKAAFKKTLFAYVAVNLLLVAIWALSGAGYFWPGWVIGGWGLGLAFQAHDAYGTSGRITEDQIAEEVQRIRGG